MGEAFLFGSFLKNKGKLPIGYTELEYIESTGTQYINTGIVPNNNTRVYLKVNYSETEGHLFGSRISTSSTDKFMLLYTADKTDYRTDYYSKNINTGITHLSQPIIIDKNKNITTFEDCLGTTYSYTHTNGTFTGTYPMFLFASNTGGTASYRATMEAYFCGIYSNGTIVRDFVPCMRDRDGHVGYYDLCNSSSPFDGTPFYGNNGTGLFVAGPEV